MATQGTTRVALDALPVSEVVKLAQGGDEQAFELLYNKNAGKIYAICLRMTRNAADAEDARQETFLLAWRKLHTFRGESAFPTWLHKIAINVVLMRQRRKKLPTIPIHMLFQPRNKATSAGDIEIQPAISNDAPQHLNGNQGADIGKPDAALKSIDTQILIREALEKIAPGYRRAIELHDFYGFQYQEIAEMWGCSTANAKSQRDKGIGALLKILAHDYSIKIKFRTANTMETRGVLIPLIASRLLQAHS